MSRKCQGVLENHLNFLKEDLKQFAEPLMKCNLQVDRNSFEVKWLACTEVRPTDYPWMASALEGTAAGAGECSEEVCGEEVEEEEDVSD
ncbi:phospholipid-translocating ATPase rsb1 [Cryomyces antarcticus]|uniref:Phospholipid-translocating ATPase rsb1 n=1 Tax=Cryomyces antarcticus TaxID=329879 RepID=A0ABR0LSF7_9PEZI|nr:phospholipid-translocating ATPase rsb1 [Cryomyces antarcticus]